MAVKKKYDVQVAFQGGGAKLCALLAAAEALEQAASGDEAKLNVTRVAGTSAGSIVAVLYAAKIPAARTRERLQLLGPKIIDKVTPKRSFLSIGWRIARSIPLYEEAKLREVLSDLLKLDGKQFERFSDLAIPVLLTATDIRNGEKKIRGLDPADHLIDAIVDSCAIPFAFRTDKQGGTIVDGGICENLPAGELVAERETKGTVIAFSFKRMGVRQAPSGVLGYAASLLNAAIDNSVERAAKQVGESHVFPISTDIGTFDFAQALDAGLGNDHYGRIRGECSAWLAALVRSWAKRTVVVDLTMDALMGKIERVHELRYDPENVRMVKSSLIVTANCLCQSDEARAAQPDDVDQEFQLLPVNRPLATYSLSLRSLATSPVSGDIGFEVSDKDLKQVECTVIPIVKSGVKGETDRKFLFFFSPALKPEDGPYTLRVHNTQMGSMAGLSNAMRKDWLKLQFTHSSRVDKLDFVVYLPEEFSQAPMMDLDLELQRDRVTGASSQYKEGRAMTSAELLPYHLPPSGYVKRGWRVEDVGYQQVAGVMILTP